MSVMNVMNGLESGPLRSSDMIKAPLVLEKVENRQDDYGEPEYLPRELP
jgi:hypothetical protein